MAKSTASALVPAAVRRGNDTLSDAEWALSDHSIATFVAQVGGKQELIDALAVADSAPDVDRIVRLLLDPRYDGYSLKRLCALAGVTVADLFVAYRKALIARSHLEASRIIAAKLPPVVDDVMTRAAPQPMTCPSCHNAPGKRELCVTCQGSGAIKTEPDLDRQKLALELGQLTQKSKGLFIQQNAIAASAATLSSPGGGMLEQLQQVVGDLLFSREARMESDPPAPREPDPPSMVPDEDDRDEPDDDEEAPEAADEKAGAS